MSDTFYLHTMDGKPAEYQEGYIVWSNHRNAKFTLATSLEQIRREQQKSRDNRTADLGYHDDCDYGYVKVRLP